MERQRSGVKERGRASENPGFFELDKLFLFLSGQGLLLAGLILIGGLAVRLALLVALARVRDPMFRDHYRTRPALASILRWSLPWANRTSRSQPVFTLAGFTFHLGLIWMPLFIEAHNIIWEDLFGWRLPGLPEGAAEAWAWAAVLAGGYLLIRRLIRPEVRVITGPVDYLLLGLSLAPLITGLIAFNQWGDYNLWIVLHLLSAELLMIIIPFTKPAHMLLFFVGRALIGVEMGRTGARSW